MIFPFVVERAEASIDYQGNIVGRDSAHYIALTRPAKITTNFRPNFKHEYMYFFYHYGCEGRGIFTIGKCGAKFKILKCSKQTLSPFHQQSTLVFTHI
jgi:hypothetical protein